MNAPIKEFTEVKPPPCFSGILLIDKPTAMTSHDVVAIIRRESRVSRVGHGGTLDPMATGLLPILVGSGTKLSDQLQGWDKSYRFDITFGLSTETGDADGAPVASMPVTSDITGEKILEASKGFVGKILQTPPMYSAIKKAGVPLYKMARKGVSVEREPREIEIYSLELEKFESPVAVFHVHCSKGTYVRSLAEDIGNALGLPAHVSRLIRTSYGQFSLKRDAHRLEDALSAIRSGRLDSLLLSPDVLFTELPSVRILDQYLPAIQKGNNILGFHLYMVEGLFNFSETIRICDRRGNCLALGQSLLSSESFPSTPKGLPVAKVVKKVKA